MMIICRVTTDLPTTDAAEIQQKLNSKDICFVTSREVPGQDGTTAMFFSCRTVTNASFLVELKLRRGFNACRVAVKSPNKAMSDLLKTTVARLISS